MKSPSRLREWQLRRLYDGLDAAAVLATHVHDLAVLAHDLCHREGFNFVIHHAGGIDLAARSLAAVFISHIKEHDVVFDFLLFLSHKKNPTYHGPTPLVHNPHFLGS